MFNNAPELYIAVSREESTVLLNGNAFQYTDTCGYLMAHS